MAARQQTMLMMTLRRTPVLTPGWGLSRASRSGIGASSAARAAVSAAGPGHGGGCGCMALQIAFCQLPHFSADFCRSAAPLAEQDRWLSPPPIAGSFLLLLSPLVMPVVCARVCVGTWCDRSLVARPTFRHSHRRHDRARSPGGVRCGAGRGQRTGWMDGQAWTAFDDV